MSSNSVQSIFNPRGPVVMVSRAGNERSSVIKVLGIAVVSPVVQMEAGGKEETEDGLSKDASVKFSDHDFRQKNKLSRVNHGFCTSDKARTSSRSSNSSFAFFESDARKS